MSQEQHERDDDLIVRDTVQDNREGRARLGGGGRGLSNL